LLQCPKVLNRGITKESERNGSKVLEPWLQVPQITLDQSFPPKSLKITDLLSYFLMALRSFPRDALIMLCSSITIYSCASSCLPTSKVFQTHLIATIIEFGFKIDISPSFMYSSMKELMSQKVQFKGYSHRWEWARERQ